MGAVSRILTAAALTVLVLPAGARAGALSPAGPPAAAPSPVAAPVPRATIESALGDVACPSDSSCFAVGSSLSADHHRRALIEHFDGRRWTIARPAPPPGLRGVSLVHVSCARPASCMAIGAGRDARRRARSFTEYWNGSRWRLAPPAPAGRARGGRGLDSVSCPAVDDCFAVGDYAGASVVEHFTGHRWAVSARFPERHMIYTNLDSVSCASPSACLATGSHVADIAYDGEFTPVARSFDGARWRDARPPPDEQTELEAVSCPSPTFCLLLGYQATGDAATAVAERWDGSMFQPVTFHSPDGGGGELRTGSCASPTSCLALGYPTEGGPEQQLGELWDGAQLSVAFTAAAPERHPWSGVACRPSFCVLVGASGSRLLAAREALEKPTGS